MVTLNWVGCISLKIIQTALYRLWIILPADKIVWFFSVFNKKKNIFLNKRYSKEIILKPAAFLQRPGYCYCLCTAAVSRGTVRVHFIAFLNLWKERISFQENNFRFQALVKPFPCLKILTCLITIYSSEQKS